MLTVTFRAFCRTTIVLLGLLSVAVGCGSTLPRITLQTDFGDIDVEIDVERAPRTAANFLRYVDEERLEGARFYRVVRLDNQPQNDIKIEVIQGGLEDEEHPNRLPPIAHESTQESGILHTDGVISMAREEPGTETCEFFICVGDQPELDFGGRRNPDGFGFSAFGRVVDGMNVVRRIQQLPDDGQYLKKNKVFIRAVKRSGR